MKAVLNVEELLVQATLNQAGRPTGKSCIHFGTVNVGKSVVELLKCLHARTLTFVACRRQDGEEDQLV